MASLAHSIFKLALKLHLPDLHGSKYIRIWIIPQWLETASTKGLQCIPCWCLSVQPVSAESSSSSISLTVAWLTAKSWRSHQKLGHSEGWRTYFLRVTGFMWPTAQLYIFCLLLEAQCIQSNTIFGCSMISWGLLCNLQTLTSYYSVSIGFSRFTFISCNGWIRVGLGYFARIVRFSLQRSGKKHNS